MQKLTIYFRDRKAREEGCKQVVGEACRACYAWIDNFYIKNETLNFDYSSTDLGNKFEGCYDCSPYIEDFYFPVRSKDKVSINLQCEGNHCGIKLDSASINGQPIIPEDKVIDIGHDVHSYLLQFEVPDAKILDISIVISNTAPGGDYKSINLHIEL
jgi:hypothetical protein